MIIYMVEAKGQLTTVVYDRYQITCCFLCKPAHSYTETTENIFSLAFYLFTLFTFFFFFFNKIKEDEVKRRQRGGEVNKMK